jgi:hypothetical protein
LEAFPIGGDKDDVPVACADNAQVFHLTSPSLHGVLVACHACPRDIEIFLGVAQRRFGLASYPEPVLGRAFWIFQGLSGKLTPHIPTT